MNLSLTVMMYHYVRDPGDVAQGSFDIPGMPVEQFCAQVDALARAHEMAAWEQVRGALQGERSLPANACLLTFDDGVRDHYLNVFPALKARGISGLFFALARQNGDGLALGHKLHFLLAHFGMEGLRAALLARLDPAQVTRWQAAEAQYQAVEDNPLYAFKDSLQREMADTVNPILSELINQNIGAENALADYLYLRDDQVREMRAGGMHFGGHSRTHPWFDFIDAAQRAGELRASCEWLANIESAPFAFAYPYGGLPDDAPAQLPAAGFMAGFTTRRARTHTDPFFIGRYDGETYRGAAN